jgi:SRSO17 transposase
MWTGGTDASAERFASYLDGIASVLGHAARVRPMRDYCTGLLLPCERKSVEPIAAVTEPGHASPQHQSLLHFVGQGEWSDAQVLEKVLEMVLPKILKHGAIEVWIIDDTGFPKHGKHSVGVKHQYCGQVGKQTNCQVAVSLSIANHFASLPVAYQLYLPDTWANDPALRKKAGIPDEIEFATKPKIARAQIEWAVKAGIPRGVALMDVAYGSDLSLRRSMREQEVIYAVAVKGSTLVRKVARRAQPMSAAELAARVPEREFRTVEWREGTNDTLASRFYRMRVQAAGEGTRDDEPAEWLLMEWPKGEKEPTKFWLSTLPENMPLGRMVDITMMRWRIERDYQELKQEVGLGHFEGRGWRGFHHHATMCIAAYGFLVSERGDFSPSIPRVGNILQGFAVPAGRRSRRSPAAA